MNFISATKYSRSFLFATLTKEEFLALSIELGKERNWQINHVYQEGFIFHLPPSESGTMRQIIGTIKEGKAIIAAQDFGPYHQENNREIVAQFIKDLRLLQNDYSSEDLENKVTLLSYDSLPQAHVPLFQIAQPQKRSTEGILDLLIPSVGYFITPILIYLNVAVFLLMVISGVDFFSPSPQSLVLWGGTWDIFIHAGQWWRLITGIFLHSGVLHLFYNMGALLFIGMFLEPIIGKSRFVTAYLLTGILSSLIGMIWHPHMVAVGASGAIMGLAGVLMALLSTSIIPRKKSRSLLLGVFVFSALTLLSGITKNINNAAHISGLICGIAIGYAFIPGIKSPQKTYLKWTTNLALTVLILSITSFYCIRTASALKLFSQAVPTLLQKGIAQELKVSGNKNEDLGPYMEGIDEFDLYESLALDIYKNKMNATKDKMRSEIKNSAIYYWKENIALIKNLDTLKLSKETHAQNKKVIKYCQYRIANCQFLYKTIQERTHKYKDSIHYYSKKLSQIINEFSTEKIPNR